MFLDLYLELICEINVILKDVLINGYFFLRDL